MTVSAAPRILVVDDELPLLRAIQDTLPRHGYVVVTECDPAAALARLAHERFDVLLTDLNLPQMNGVALLGRAVALDPLLMGIVMTGQGTIDTAVQAMKTGAHDYILKPFKLSIALAVITRALAARQLREANGVLQQQLAARTAELELINRELEAFSYSVSHDLRAPLRTLAGFTSVIEEELGPSPSAVVADGLRRIRRAVGRMDRLTSDLIRLACVNRGELDRGEVDLTPIAVEVAAQLQAESPDRRVEWRLQPVPPASGDSGLLRVVLENLLANAWKYTRDTPDARVEFSSTLQNDVPVYRVSDNGVGFDVEHARGLFSPFQRFHSEQKFEGSGVGLATVQRIVHRHGGQIWAESAPGCGATFHFLLPKTLSGAGGAPGAPGDRLTPV